MGAVSITKGGRMGLFKRSGGFDATITDVRFETREFEGKNGAFTKRNAVLEYLVDGAEAPAIRFIDAGFVREGQGLSEDGRTLTSADGGGVIEENTEFARFVGSAIEKGFPESKFPEDGSSFTALAGSRMRLYNWVDEEATKKRGKRKGKDGKEYNITELRVAAVHAVGNGQVRATQKGVAKAGNGVVKAATAPKTNGKVAVAPDTDRADEILLNLIGDYGKDGALERYGVSAAMVKYKIKHKEMTEEERDSLRGLLIDEEYLTSAAERGVIAYDASKGNPKMKGVIAATAAPFLFPYDRY
jgi:hypothetical protein